MSYSRRLDRVKPITLHALKVKDSETLQALIKNKELFPCDWPELDAKGDFASIPSEFKSALESAEKSVTDNAIPRSDQTRRFVAVFAESPNSAWYIFQAVLNSPNAVANDGIQHMLEHLIKMEAINDQDRWDQVFSFYSQQLKKLPSSLIAYYSHVRHIKTALKNLAKLPFAKVKQIDEVILQHFIANDFGAAFAHAQEIAERKEVPDSRICKDLVAVANHNKFQTEKLKLRFRADAKISADQLGSKLKECHTLMEDALNRWFDFHFALELLGYALDIKSLCQNFHTETREKHPTLTNEMFKSHFGVDLVNIYRLTHEMMQSIFNERVVRDYPIELSEFAFQNRDKICKYVPIWKKRIDELLKPVFEKNIRYKKFVSEDPKSAEELKESFDESGFWSYKDVNDIVKLAQLDSNNNAFLNHFNRIKFEILKHIHPTSQHNMRLYEAVLIELFSIFKTGNPNYFILIKTIAINTIKEITEISGNKIPTVSGLKILAALYKNLYDNNKSCLIDETQIGVLQKYLSVVKDLATHKDVDRSSLFDIVKSLFSMTKNNGDPVRTLLAQHTFNEVCNIGFMTDLSHSLLALIGYPLAIGAIINTALTGDTQAYHRGTLLGCHALVLLTQNPERTRQHFGLLHGEISSLLNLRAAALEYVARHSTKWPEFKAYFEKNAKYEGSLYPLADLMNHEHSLKREDVTSAFQEFINFAPAQFANFAGLFLSAKVNVQDAVEHKSESKAESVAKPREEEPKQQEGVPSKVASDLEERKESQVAASSSPLSALSFLTKTPEAKQSANPPAIVLAQARAISPRSQPKRDSGILNEIEGGEPGQAEMETLTLTIIGFTEDNDKQIGELLEEDVPYNTDLIMDHLSFAIDAISDANKDSKKINQDPKKFTFTLENSAGRKTKLPIPLDLKARKDLIDKLLNRWLAPSALNMLAEHKEEPGASFQLRKR